MKKIHESHPGWLSHIDGCKDHYYFQEEGEFVTSLCGQIKSNKYLDTYLTEVEDMFLCKRCISKLKKLENGEKIEINIKGMLI